MTKGLVKLMIEFEFMKSKHVDEVMKIEEASFTTPWTRSSILEEINKNKMAIYIVALEEGKVVGYGGMWHVINEGHITNIAVDENYRGRGVASSIIDKLTEIAMEKDMIGLTLEVRVSNEAARRLYGKNGFKMEGIRKEYYSDNMEDALIMWKYLIDESLII